VHIKVAQGIAASLNKIAEDLQPERPLWIHLRSLHDTLTT